MVSLRWSGVLFLMAVLAAFASGGASAAGFPDSSVSLLVPYPAGGATDIAIRPLADAAKKALGQPVVVDNRSGGGGAVAMGAISGKKPDGYLLSVAATSLHRNSYVNKLPFDTVKDVTPVSRVGGYLYGILVRPDSPHKTLKDLVEYARANPGKVTYMASGVGTGGHIAMEELGNNAGGVKFSHIPSKGDPESNTALLGGHVDCISTTSGWIPLVEAGKLRLLATYGDKRMRRFPEAPTVAELGYKVVHNSPFGVFGPKGMAKNVVKVLDDAFKKATEDPTFMGAMDKYEMPIMYQTAEEFAKYWAEAYVEAGVQVKRYFK
jgi:tripartite-type tricarboxylate transporter receptor subunit TctC